MVYADETFYTEKYLLGRKPVISTGFPFYARQASQLIDQYTFNRLKDASEASEEVHVLLRTGRGGMPAGETAERFWREDCREDWNLLCQFRLRPGVGCSFRPGTAGNHHEVAG